jgi:hypothetical protein
MDNHGWEIQPAGWILLVILAVLLLYYIWSRLEHPSEQNS